MPVDYRDEETAASAASRLRGTQLFSGEPPKPPQATPSRLGFAFASRVQHSDTPGRGHGRRCQCQCRQSVERTGIKYKKNSKLQEVFVIFQKLLKEKCVVSTEFTSFDIFENLFLKNHLYFITEYV